MREGIGATGHFFWRNSLSKYTVYHHIPKTGGTSIEIAFKENFTAIPVNFPDRVATDFLFENPRDGRFFIHSHIYDMKYACDLVDIKPHDVKHVISVRDPIDRLFSQFYHNVLSTHDSVYNPPNPDPGHPIELWVKKQGAWLQRHRDLINECDVTFIRQENLNEDFKKAFDLDIDLQIFNETAQRFTYRHLNFFLLKDRKSLSAEDTEKLKEETRDEYEVLKSFGIEYDIDK